MSYQADWIARQRRFRVAAWMRALCEAMLEGRQWVAVV